MCEYTSRLKHDISVHKSQQHKDIDPEEMCDDKSNPSTLQDTLNVLNNSELRNANIAFTCSVCEYECETKTSIINHMILEHKKRRQSETKNYCTNLFNHSKALKIDICLGVCEFMTS